MYTYNLTQPADLVEHRTINMVVKGTSPVLSSCSVFPSMYFECITMPCFYFHIHDKINEQQLL